MNNNFDVIVIGGGHAGVEASLIAAKKNKKVALINLYEDKIAAMPCNPSIGGPAKGIVVREIDALGGEMAKAADATSIQTKLLNSSKGPGVWSLRTQNDKVKYSAHMLKKIKEEKNIELIVDTATEILIDNNKAIGIKMANKGDIFGKSVILTTGTYMSSTILRGEEEYKSGPNDEITSSEISENLKKIGFKLNRFKTGTPARVKQNSIDLKDAQVENGTEGEYAFSFSTKKFLPIKEQKPCYLIYSTNNTKEIIEKNLTKSPMYSDKEHGIGPRYCPSFEDKIVRFSSRDRHQIFLEPESDSLDTFYVQGFSTSMPIDVQKQMLESLPGFENVVVDKWAYAIEYDCIDPMQLKLSLESKKIENLFFAGQINGTSGYEEAAAQGLIAGINACQKIDEADPLILKRSEAYIGVMIDDLINKGVDEPYRLLTSRAEHRLTLRNDNAELRLKDIAFKLNLISNTEFEKFREWKLNIDNALEILKSTRFSPKSELANNLRNLKQADISKGYSAYELIKQPTIDAGIVFQAVDKLPALSINQINYIIINIRFEGYIKKENSLVNNFNKLEVKKIPEDINYDQVENIALEAKQKLKKIRPTSIGQASRISGINPADIQMLLIFLKKKYPNLNLEKE